MAVWAAFNTAASAYFVLVIVVTYAGGGAAAVGAATALNMLPSGLLGPLAATLANSRRPQLHLAIGTGARGVVMIATVIAVLNGAPILVILALVGTDSLVSSGVRPLHGALVVGLADTPREAAAANAATSLLLNASALAGPVLAGLALGPFGIGWAFAVPAALYGAGAIAAMFITTPPRPDSGQIPDGTASQPSIGILRAQLNAMGQGFQAIARSRAASAATILFVVNMALVGVWYVASASVSNDRLGLGENGVTIIMSVYGVGGLIGALAMLAIVGRGRLARVLAGAMLAWALTLAAIGTIVVPEHSLALAVAMGVARAITYAIVPTLVQRSVASTAMVPAAASLQSLYLLGLGAGAVIAPLLIDSIGVHTALAIAGGAAILITLLLWPRLRRADLLSDDDAAKLAAMRAVPMLGRLPELALEQLARTAIRLAVPAGTEVIHQNEHGQRFYVITAGRADVTVDGQLTATLGPSESFGEAALLHDVVRSATVTARQDLELIAFDRAAFLDAHACTCG